MCGVAGCVGECCVCGVVWCGGVSVVGVVCVVCLGCVWDV